MANFILSAFADEIDPNFEEQLKGLKKLDIPYVELRGVNGKSFTLLTDDEVLDVRDLLARYGIKVWSLGSPIGKIHTNDDFEAHKHLLTRIMDIGDMLDVKRIRMFSFYPEAGISREEFEKKAFSMVGELLDMAEARGFVLCHENEKDIYGQSAESVKKLCDHFGGRLRAVLDSGNLAFSNENSVDVYPLLKDYIEYLHIKDAEQNGAIVVPGTGDAHLAETLAQVNADRTDDVVLTVEPHLTVFGGLSSLSNLDDIKHKNVFSTAFEAFETATEALRGIINNL